MLALTYDFELTQGVHILSITHVTALGLGSCLIQAFTHGRKGSKSYYPITKMGVILHFQRPTEKERVQADKLHRCTFK